ncbi:YbaK/EbsC family protein [Isoptericola hypogeus]|uniref:YbaK/EbsC family protein n=1 Tax=Isoptericola hypogeus TaxID=300179 RepID=A0ABN2JBX2_9MICO
MNRPATPDDAPEGSPGEFRAREALEASGIAFEITRHGPVGSLEEAARVRGLRPEQVVKSLVVRRAEDDYLFVLVPGGRTIAWPRLRALLGVSRLSMPDRHVAREVTGYERGTITPFGSTRPWPVVADERVVAGPVSIGAGAHGVAATVDGAALAAALGAQVADVTDPEPGATPDAGESTAAVPPHAAGVDETR